LNLPTNGLARAHRAAGELSSFTVSRGRFLMVDVANRGVGGSGQRGQEKGGSQKQEESGGVIGSVMEGAGNVASSVASAAGQAWDATKEGVQTAASAVADAAETAWDSTTGLMRRYPMATFAAGIGLGFLLCLALRSSSR
jgi:hypothetical protein